MAGLSVQVSSTHEAMMAPAQEAVNRRYHLNDSNQSPQLQQSQEQLMPEMDSPSTSYCSLLDSSSSDGNGSATRPTNSLLKMNKNKRSMKSSFALTSLLQQHQQQQPEAGDDYLHQFGAPLRMPDVSTTPQTNSYDDVGSDVLLLDATLSNKPQAMTPVEFGHLLQETIASHIQNGPQEHHPDIADIQQQQHRPQQQQREVLLDFARSPALRQTLELPLRYARRMRDLARAKQSGRTTSYDNNPAALGSSSWMGLPYASLRDERPFLYDHTHTHPLTDTLCQVLGIDDLSQLHQTWDPSVESARDHQRRSLSPLLDQQQQQSRMLFQQCYDGFVTSCCIPLLHASALNRNVFNSFRNTHHVVLPGGGPPGGDRILYRYQVFPEINIVYPNDYDACVPPTCDLNRGGSTGWLHFHVPLTRSTGTAALYCERYPGREDWHPLRCSSIGLGFCWDGARCLRFVPLNTTGQTRVSIDFRVLLVRSSTTTTLVPKSSLSVLHGNNNNYHHQHHHHHSHDHHHLIDNDDNLCRPEHLVDVYTQAGDGFFDEAMMDLGASKFALVQKTRRHYGKNGPGLLEPDARCGFPFQTK